VNTTGAATVPPLVSTGMLTASCAKVADSGSRSIATVQFSA
jgi:hypothetical protein